MKTTDKVTTEEIVAACEVRAAVPVPFMLRPALDGLTDSECGVLLRLMFDYAQDKREPDFSNVSRVVQVVFSCFRKYEDDNAMKYYKTVQMRREAGRASARGRRRKDKEPDDVAAIIQEEGLPFR